MTIVAGNLEELGELKATVAVTSLTDLIILNEYSRHQNLGACQFRSLGGHIFISDYLEILQVWLPEVALARSQWCCSGPPRKKEQKHNNKGGNSRRGRRGSRRHLLFPHVQPPQEGETETQ